MSIIRITLRLPCLNIFGMIKDDIPSFLFVLIGPITRRCLSRNNLGSYSRVRIVKITDDKVTDQEIILQKMGRVRDAGVAPDGAIYIVTNGPDRVLKLLPKF